VTRSLRRHLSFANVVSILALFIALGGTSYSAVKLTGKDVRDGSLTGKDVKNSSLGQKELSNAAVEFLSGKIGPQGTPGITGATGPQGTPGPKGAPGAAAPVNSVDGTNIVDGSIGALDLGTNSVDGSKVLNDSLTTADVAGADVNGATISIVAGAVANGSCEDFAVGISGAKAGEAVVFSIIGSVPEGVLIYGERVPSDNTVTTKVCNLSGAAMGAISELPIRVITFG
jgi:hypothetical protein